MLFFMSHQEVGRTIQHNLRLMFQEDPKFMEVLCNSPARLWMFGDRSAFLREFREWVEASCYAHHPDAETQHELRLRMLTAVEMGLV